jgi:hypothetical protein
MVRQTTASARRVFTFMMGWVPPVGCNRCTRPRQAKCRREWEFRRLRRHSGSGADNDFEFSI